MPVKRKLSIQCLWLVDFQRTDSRGVRSV